MKFFCYFPKKYIPFFCSWIFDFAFCFCRRRRWQFGAIIKTSQSKTFKTSVSFKANLSKIEQKVKFNPSVRQNGLKKIQIKRKSAFFMWKYLKKLWIWQKNQPIVVIIVTNPVKKTQCRTKVRFFVAGKSEQVKNLWNFKTKVWLHFMWPYGLFKGSASFKKLINCHNYSNENVILRQQIFGFHSSK